MKLTERAIARLVAPHPSGKQQLFWEAELTGFGVLVSGITSVKSYVVQRAIDGRTRRVTIGPTNVIDLNAARKRAEEVLADFYKGVDPKAGRRGTLTLRAALDGYLAACKDLRPATVDIYRGSITTWLDDWLDKPLRSITRDMVEARHRRIQADVAARGRYAGDTSANMVMRCLRTVWSFYKDRDADSLPANNPARLRRQWFPENRRTRMVRAEDMPKFYAALCALRNPVARDYILLMLFTGLRRGEAAALTWNDIDFADRVIRVPAATTKAGRKLDLPMSDIVHDMLVARRAIGRDQYVFPANSRSGHITDPKSVFGKIQTGDQAPPPAINDPRSLVSTP